MLRLYNLFVHLMTIGTVVWLMFFSSAQGEPLASWNDGPARTIEATRLSGR